MAKEPYKLTEGEIQILREGANHPSLITNYFFRGKGAAEGFIFDKNFTEEGAWQEDVCMATQPDICVIGGFGSGKTLGVGMGAAVWCMTTPFFKFLNVAPRAWQAKQMYEMMLTWAKGTPFENLIWSFPKRPYPTIVLRFMVEDTMIESTMEFMSADKDATGILSWEGDWINIEEAGLLDNLDEVITSVGSRLRGTIRGRTRLGRLSMISNSWFNPILWEQFDKAEEDPVNQLSIVVSTRDNKNVTEKQLERFLSRIPESEHKQFIDGLRPEGKGDYFAKEAVYRCEDKLLGEALAKAIEEGRPGFSMEKTRETGIYHFETPYSPHRMYMVFGDPGIDSAPKRNAPVLLVFDVTDIPREPAVLAAMWWGDGGGRITPFVDMLQYFNIQYNAVFSGIDSTSTQRNTAEMINLQSFTMEIMGKDESEIKSISNVTGMDFSGAKKAGYLVALRMFIENRMLVWPDIIEAFRQQLTNYSYAKDNKIPQDLVAALAMAAWAIRIYFNVQFETEGSADDEEDSGPYGRYADIINQNRQKRASARTRQVTQRSPVRSRRS